MIDYFWLKVAIVLLVGIPLLLGLVWQIYNNARAIFDDKFLAKHVYKKNKKRLLPTKFALNEDGIETITTGGEINNYPWGKFLSYTQDGLLFFLLLEGKEPHLIIPTGKIERKVERELVKNLIEKNIAA